jgi:phosphoribosylformylglycinamidine synthase II
VPVHRIDVALAPGLSEPRADEIRARLGLGAAVGIEVFDTWWVASDADDAAFMLEVLLCGAGRAPASPREEEAWTSIDIALLPGMTDTAGAELLKAWSRVPGASPAPRAAASGRHVAVARSAGLTPDALADALVNPVIERFAPGGTLAPFLAPARAAAEAARIPVRGATDTELLGLGASRQLSLDLAELRAIASHFEALGRDPTDVEVELLAQTWSEHCNHKTFRASIDLTVVRREGAETRHLDGLLETCFAAPTRALARPWVVSAFEDNAGRVALTDDLEVAAKVETHNRPSALVPFAGAMTGVGGVLRDILGVSARPFAALDVLAFGPRSETAPPGFLSPARVRDGVIAGIADYGNRFGVPTVAGALLEHPAHVTNPLVFAGALGVLPAGAHPSGPAPGDLIVVAGGATGRDGLRGATFSSSGLDGASAAASGGAVQLGDPLMGRLVMELVLEARDAGLYRAITDCGAGGLSSAVGELARHVGADAAISDIPSKYHGMAAWELWLSESQERMVLAVPPAQWPRLQALAADVGCPVASIGAFRSDRRLVVRDRGDTVVDLDLDVVHGGCPRRHLEARWTPPEGLPKGQMTASPRHIAPSQAPEDSGWLSTLGRYDVEIQGGTRGRPVVGLARRGRGEGVALLPLELQGRRLAPHVALGLGLCPELTAIDPRVMAWLAVDEALRQVVSVGADPARIALLDNFAWGDVDTPEGLGSLALACIGCAEAATLFGTPFISGKDSLRNTYRLGDGRRRSIPGTLVVTAVGRVPEGVRPLCPSRAAPGDVILWIGREAGSLDPESWLPPADTPALYAALHGAIATGLLTSCRDVHTGGIPGALQRLATACGRALDLDAPPPPEPTLAATHSAARFVVTVRRDVLKAVSAALEGHPYKVIGRVI